MRTVLFVVMCAVAACGGKSKGADTTATEKADTRPLYDRLGGTEGITKVVDAFVAKTGSDPRIAQFFTNADIPHLKQMMVEHICENTGGPCKYSGKTMKESHTGMKVKKADFDAFMDDLTQTLDAAGVKAREKGEVLAFFNGLEKDVVELP